MKKITSLFLLLGMAVMVAQPVTAQTLRDDIREDVEEEIEENVSEETQEAIGDALDSTVENRKAGILAGLDAAATKIDNAQAQLDSSDYASAATVDDCSTALDGAESQLVTVRADVEAATDNDTLSEARIAAVDWVVENKDVAKECAISLALDGIEEANGGVEDSVEYAEKVLLPYYEYYELDTTTLEALIQETKDELDVAVPAYETAEDERTQSSLEAASRASAEAVVASARMYEEAVELTEELESVE